MSTSTTAASNTAASNTSTSILSTLKLSSTRKLRTMPDVVKRRNKLLVKLGEQRALAQAVAEGRHYSPTRMRTLRNVETGTSFVKEVPIRIKPWFWTGEKGEVLLSVHYGSKQIELIKGKTTVEVGTADNLGAVLASIIEAVKNGELDVQIEAASVKLRDGFRK